MQIVLAVVVLLAGLAITQLVQRWLTDSYLPKTELDLGARNSVSTVARYVGIIIACAVGGYRFRFASGGAELRVGPDPAGGTPGQGG
ncbi:hypothetical protein G6F51_014592 [Rhizopus arrhizus]|uniref:Uncharacterized protein n=1 Tax=Rhizopus oryzae TaxID=64495 RepID=A0A9P7BYX5_RHIOR|nr:hypothetical protein G6F51_014592 [Rhizopus arrhizus]